MAVPTLKDPSLLRSQCFIGGEWHDADDGRVIDVTNPADGSVVASVPRMGAGETQRAIESAEQAQSGWRALSGKQRAAVLRKWFELLIENQDDLAAIMTAEQGKPLPEARGEIAYAASYIEWFGEGAK
ncbi:aldehyde dehydrogenase family protein, partial [Rhizobium sp. SEMIA 4085]|uniref:aldehyde dehydrogenase family protein n=1 Tax=Rhizobium sp. SEMIA 4085 TaxID=2137761 RepID=UPI001478E491